MVVMVGLVGAACSGEITGDIDAVSLRIDERGPNHMSGSAELGEFHVRFESTSTEQLVGHVLFEFDHGAVAYGLSVPDNDFWSDGQGIALRDGDVLLMRGLTDALAAEMGNDPDSLGFAEMLLASMTAYMSEAPVGYTIPSHTKPITSTADGTVLYSLNDDGIRCAKRYSWYWASWSWAGYSATQPVQVNENGSCIGKCGDCGFGIGQSWTLDCLEHDWCIRDAASKNLPVVGESPFDSYCGDEWQEAEDDFLLGWVWPFNCRG